ncbi:Rad4-domain-containing protein [Cristinia sonorae]|uniref:Rad4-domain-containing protein n=1 Tax=Cristinia sonorae TaxID=1940300 RepID=A0A8K0XSS9_9AGAR|nr:Rad4-domain-containing protein [Cristinia sonorae]
MAASREPTAEAESDDDFDWEEVDVPQPSALDISLGQDEDQPGPSRGNIEITIQARPKPDEAAKQKAAQIAADRAMRLDCHKMHTICLIANAQVRNKWLNDKLLHARLMSLTPMTLQNAFVISKARVPEAPMRGRMFENAVSRLAEWWHSIFEVETTGHLRNRTFDEVRQMLSTTKKGKSKAQDSDPDDEDLEIIRSEKSLMKHALMKSGSRDTCAQLFTALCRALGIPSRLVVSLQSVPWQAGVGKPKKTYKKKPKGKGKEKVVDDDEGEDDDMEMEEVSIPDSPLPTTNGKGKGKTFPGSGHRLDGTPNASGSVIRKTPPVVKLRKSRGQKLGSASAKGPPRKLRPQDPRESAPVFWTEVFSRADGRWIPVDPVRCIVNKRRSFDPDQSSNPNVSSRDQFKVENRMVYVIALEEDGYARDVTPRYAREYGAKVSKVQQGGKGRKQWWEMVLSSVTRPYRLNRDDVEDEELHNNQLTEQMPSSMSGFKDHPLYVLARHLKRDEVIYPLTELGKFRGEPVYPRSSVMSLKTAENWMRQGRKVREGCQPMKWVKQRAATVNKMRAIELAISVGGEKDVMQGLYSMNQTELYQADPITNGVVPKNDFGNIDLYVPSMLPAGGAYIPHKGAAKIARQLGFDYAEAVTSFEFKKRRAFPVITGIVVAAENEQTILEAFLEAEHEAELKRQVKRKEQVIKRWTRFVQGLRIRQRLQEQYADRSQQPSGDATPVANDEFQVAVQEAGGFLVGADDVVQPYNLPRDLHDKPSTPPAAQNTTITTGDVACSYRVSDHPTAILLVADDEDENVDMYEEIIPTVANAVPKTMRELAENAEKERKEGGTSSSTRQQSPVTITLPANAVNGKINGRTTRSGTRTPAASVSSRKGKGKATPTQSTPRPSRKRTRRDSDVSNQGDPDSEVEVMQAPTPAKRARPTPTPVKSDRVLRARKGKSDDKVREEQEMEKAYQRAVAG